MTRKKFRNLCITLCDRIQMNHDGTHIKGSVLKWYRDKDLTTIKAKSYAEAWEALRLARECVGM